MSKHMKRYEGKRMKACEGKRMYQQEETDII